MRSASEREAALDQLIDRTEIYDCDIRYCRGMDRQDRELMLSAFHPDAVDDHVMICETPEKFADWVLDGHRESYKATAFFLTNHTVELDGDQAHAETYVFRMGEFHDPTLPLQFVGARYVDRFERRDGEWRIAARVCVLSFVGEMANTGSGDVWKDVMNAGGMVARDRTDISYQRPLTPRAPGAVEVDR